MNALNTFYYTTSAGILQVTCNDKKIIETIFIDEPISDVLDMQQLNVDEFPQLQIEGTVFQKKVWQATLQIPAGTTWSYNQLAQYIGHPYSWRAVAKALSQNKIAYFIPCHRVVRKNGDVSGYRWGIERKVALLKSESIL